MSSFEYYEIRPCVEHDGATHSFLGQSEWCESRGAHIHTPSAAEIEAVSYTVHHHVTAPVFWTLYGRVDGMAQAIGDFVTFEAAFDVLNAILGPMASARDTIRNCKFGLRSAERAASDLEDVILQSTMRDRL